jgi:hypothetical protein
MKPNATALRAGLYRFHVDVPGDENLYAVFPRGKPHFGELAEDTLTVEPV